MYQVPYVAASKLRTRWPRTPVNQRRECFIQKLTGICRGIKRDQSCCSHPEDRGGTTTLHVVARLQIQWILNTRNVGMYAHATVSVSFTISIQSSSSDHGASAKQRMTADCTSEVSPCHSIMFAETGSLEVSVLMSKRGARPAAKHKTSG